MPRSPRRSLPASTTYQAWQTKQLLGIEAALNKAAHGSVTRPALSVMRRRTPIVGRRARRVTTAPVAKRAGRR